MLDLSYEGCKIRPERPLSQGDKLQLGVFRLGLIEAEVRWYDEGIAGLVFTSVDEPARKQWPRQSDRVAVTAAVTLRRPGKPNFAARVIDVSPEGCKVEFVDRPSIGERAWIKFEGLETLDSEVCWVGANAMGVNFAKSMHPAVFDLLVARLGPED